MDDQEFYRRFVQYFVEITDHLNGLQAEAEELLSLDEEVPRALANEVFRHETIIEILTQKGEEAYNKTAKQLYQDGWTIWFKEDSEMREKRYGGKGNA